MKRVLMLAYWFPPSRAAGTFRTLRFVRDLPECGWRPSILTVTPESYVSADLDPELLHKLPNDLMVHRTRALAFPHWYARLVQAGKTLGLRGAGVVGGTSAPTPAPLFQQPAPVRAERASVSELLFTLCRTPDIDAGWYGSALVRGLWVIARERPQALYASGGPWTTFVIARDLSRLSGVPLVCDYRDPWTGNPSVRRFGGAFERLALRLESSVARRARYLVANSDVLRETLIRAHGEAVGAKTIVIHNSFDPDDFASPTPPRDAEFTLRYVGSLYDAHSPEPFLRALAVILERRPTLRGKFRVHLVGVGAARTGQLVQQLALQDVVQVQGPVAHAEAVRLERAAQALLLFLTVPSDPSTFVPSKLFEYVAARRPIFAVTSGGALERLLRRRRLTSWIYRPEDTSGMAEGIANLLDRYQRGCLPALSETQVAEFSSPTAARALAAVLEAASARRPLEPCTFEASESEAPEPARVDP